MQVRPTHNGAGMVSSQPPSQSSPPLARRNAFRRAETIEQDTVIETKPAKVEKSWKFRSLISKKGREDTRSTLLLAGLATVPVGGFTAVAMADGAGGFSPFMRTVQKILLPYAASTSVLVGLPLAVVVLPAAALVAGIGETIGRLPVPKLVAQS